MIIVKLIGGLGNQMFQYAIGRRLSLELGVPLKLDLTSFATYKLRTFELSNFSLAVQEASASEIASFTQPRSRARRLISRAIPALARRRWVEKAFHFDPTYLRPGRNAYLEGYWQSEKYFDSIAPQIRTDFKVRVPASGPNQQAAGQIGATESVALHVRRGDYATNPETMKVHGVCSLDHYAAAIRLIAEKLPGKKLHFYVFSDDPKWVKENLRIEHPATYIDFNDADRSFEDMRLMSQCKHQIIANSTFSWWGAWLNANPSKIVIAPKQWFANSPHDTSDLIPSSWTRI